MEKKTDKKPEYTGMDEEDLDDEEKEILKQEEEKKTKTKSKEKQEEIRERYVVFKQLPRIGIADAESKEVIAEGEEVVLEALAKILGALERIEARIGSLTTD